jgi:hypothetical protein
MDIKQAISIITEYGNTRGIKDILVVLKYMDDHFFLLNLEEKQAFNRFVNVGKEFFAPVQEEKV